MNFRRLLPLALVLALVVACGGSTARAIPSPTPSPSPSAPAIPSPSPSPSPEGAPTPSPLPAIVLCVARPGGGPMVVVGSAIYEVTDATHPKLLCHFANTQVHLFTLDTFAYIRPGATKSDIVLHSMSSGHDSAVASVPLPWLGEFGNPVAFTPDGNVAASWDTRYAGAGGTDPTIHVTLFAQNKAEELVTFPMPVADCASRCRFGLPPPVLALSPDGAYLAVGWPVDMPPPNWGAVPVSIYTVGDRKLLKTFDTGYNYAFWAPAGHRLLLGGQQAAAVWTPESGLAELQGAAGWAVEPNRSPDGNQVAFTGYQPTDDPQAIRVFAYDSIAEKTSMLTNRLRSEVVFVKAGWVWYRQEQLCAVSDSQCGSGGSRPTDVVYAMDLGTRVETTVAFAAGQSPTALDTGWGPGDFWPIG